MAQPVCKARFPHIGATFRALVSKLAAHPIRTAVALLRTEQRVKVVLEGGALVNWMSLANHHAAEAPLEIDELAHGHPRAIARQWAASGLGPGSGIVGQGLRLSVMCSEWVPMSRPLSSSRGDKRPFRHSQPPCWRTPHPWPSSGQTAESGMCPRHLTRFVLSCEARSPPSSSNGSFDNATGAKSGTYIARTLPNSTVVNLRGVAHGTFVNSCAVRVILSFYDAPTSPNTSCVASVKPPPFKTTRG